MTAAGYLLVSYALSTTVLAIRAGSAVAVAVHAVAAAALIGARKRNAEAWLPIVVAPVLYFTLPDLMRGWAGGEVHYRDAMILRWELLFFGDPSRTLATKAPSCVLSEVLHAGYLSYYPLIFVPAVLLWRAGDRAGTRVVASAAAIAFVVCYVAFIVYPVQGPRYVSTPQGICEGLLRATAMAVLEGGSSRGAAFPSSHVAVAVAVSIVSATRGAAWAWVALLSTVLLALGAVYGGFHYAADVVGGALAGTAAALMGIRLGRSAGDPPAPLRRRSAVSGALPKSWESERRRPDRQ